MNKLFLGFLFVLLVNSLSLFGQSGLVSKKTIGVIFYTGYPGKGHPVNIYARKGQLLRQLVVNDNLSDDPIISPFAMSGEYNLLVFDCIGTTEKEYIVLANNNTGLTGYIKKQQKDVIFQTWSQHLQKNGPSIDFDEKTNPIHLKPEFRSPIVKSNKPDFYFKKRLQGDWMQIYWETPKKGSGWIRWWNAKNKLLIGIYYIM